MTAEDPALYVTGLWHRLPEPRRALVLDTDDEDEEVRRRAWEGLVRCADPEAIALALDFFLTDRATARFGEDAPQDRDGVRLAALWLLDRPPFAGLSRFGERAANASHILALRALGFAARVGDIAQLPPLPADLAAAGELVVAWSAAAEEALRQGEADAGVLRQLSAIAANQHCSLVARTGAVLAIRASADPMATAALRDLVRRSEGEVRIEILAALAASRRLDSEELAMVRELLAHPPRNGTFDLRKSDLQAGLSPPENGGA
jgi:hypothetical protein